MNDRFGREIDYLRISVTDRCNLRCLYCMPERGVDRLRHEDILRYEEIKVVVEAAQKNGISKVRITGGEPLVRPGIVELVEMLGEIDGIEDLSLTTNGLLLPDLAGRLAEAGLNRVNISLDSLNPESYRTITRGGILERVFEGLDAAADAGFDSIKINTVIIRGFNDHEIEDLSVWAFQNKHILRFIEFMPVNNNLSVCGYEDTFVSSDEIKERVISRFPDLGPCILNGNGPAVYWCVPNQEGSIGFIEAVSHFFCGNCNRLRLTADGRLKPCLFSNEEVNLIPALRGTHGNTEGLLSELFAEAVAGKPKSHDGFRRVTADSRCMNEIGG